jgi:SAM-dependent methyltransferase
LKYIKGSLSKLGLQVRRQMFPGFGLWQVNFYFRQSDLSNFRGSLAFRQINKMDSGTLLDIGSGACGHANKFAENGFDVTAVDLGTSIYSKQGTKSNKLELVTGSFLDLEFDRKFDYVWCSHFLEHQRNAGSTIDKILNSSKVGGTIAVVLPFPHRNMAGGHLSFWTPGLVIYNFLLGGNCMKDAEVLIGSSEFSVIFKRKPIVLPNGLTFDAGDLEILEEFLPRSISEKSDMWDA